MRALPTDLQRLAAALAAALLLAVAAHAGASTSNKWRLEVSGGAESDGSIVLEIAPVGRAPVRVEVALRRGRSENGVARDIAKAIDAKLDGELVDAETDDGEDVLVKRRLGAPVFSLTVVSNSVKGVRLNLDRE
jgi:phage tail sheath gpL-like